MNRFESIQALSDDLGFRVVGDRRVEFMAPDGKVRATQPVSDWQVDLWNKCVSLLMEVKA